MLCVCNNTRFVYMSRIIPTVHSLELYVYSLIKIIILCIIKLYSGTSRNGACGSGVKIPANSYSHTNEPLEMENSWFLKCDFSRNVSPSNPIKHILIPICNSIENYNYCKSLLGLIIDTI